MSYKAMSGQTVFIGTTIGEGELVFSDGTIQTTAYTATKTGDSTSLSIDTLNVADTATIGSQQTYHPSLTIYGSVQQLLTDSASTAFGQNCLTNDTTGANNTAFGANSMALNTTGYCNTGVGDYSLSSNTTGFQNTAIGHWSQQYTTGSQNTSLGSDSLQENTTGSGNTAIGYGSSSYNTTGCYNTSIGYNSGSGNNSYSTAVGYNASNTASHQILLGTSAETVSIPGTANVSGALSSGSLTVNGNYNADGAVNITGGVNINNIGGVEVNSSVFINSNNTTIIAATENLFQSATNYLNSKQTTITGNSTIGTSSSNTMTVNAIPNFVNGFQCNGSNAYRLYMGTANYISVDMAGTINETGIPPEVNSGGTGQALYLLDQNIQSIIGCFVNGSNSSIVFWYNYQLYENQIYCSISNLATTTQYLPGTIQYIAFAAI